MSLRAALVDDLKTVTAVTDIVGDNITDMFYDFEDFLNSAANSVGKFPAISVESDAYEPENNLDGHDNLIDGLYTITCFQIVNLSKMRSRSLDVRNDERDKLREVDALAQLVVDYLVDKRGIVGSYYLRQPHIEAVADGDSGTGDNREIVTRVINFSITYSVVIPPTGFSFTVDTTQAGTASDTMLLPMPAGPLVDWGDGTINNLNTHTYSAGGVKSISIAGAVTGWKYNNSGDKSKLITIDNAGGLVIDSNTMFFGCNNATFIDISGALIDTSSFNQQFKSTSSLLSLNLTKIDTSLVSNFDQAFRNPNPACVIIGAEDLNIGAMSNGSSMFSGVTLPTSQYDELLINYEAQTHQNNVNFHGGNSQYSAAAVSARAALVSDGWTITDGGLEP